MIAADTMAKRTNLRKYPEQKIVNADLILYYIAVLDKYNWAWFPILYVYGEEMGKIETFQKLKSRRHFEKVKGLFMANNSEELKSLLVSFEQPDGYCYQESFRTVPSLLYHIKPEEVCTFL